ncbi:hypothetical protein BREU_1247 [Bifidobacterium reuteri DSM 23975]|uniref:Uncharacterized protein n=1 Tax=Bifidobacterium reuteri DSM 23975 TaxID=1437610 RepID=A0A087CMH3_9BIFI|nr:hypothetical protein [Bifidobacterium reuteri]KFI84473.1 hypothetical protein BREU_1247 [Bifidobacterium reuteri DSM 23975]
MGYAVDYKPRKTRARRQVPKNKAQRTKDIKNAIRWNLGRLEHDTVSSDTVSRPMAIQLLNLNKIAPTADPTGDHVMQQLISEGIVLRPKKRAGVQVFDRDDLVRSLRAWAGVK